jgi:hypothetical protein
VYIHLPTGILLNTFVDSNIPVIAPNGESNNDKPRLPSVKPSLNFMPGMEATQIPNKRLEVANKKPTARTGLFLIKDKKFLIMIKGEMKGTNLR